jgi:hypothetical protein
VICYFNGDHGCKWNLEQKSYEQQNNANIHDQPFPELIVASITSPNMSREARLIKAHDAVSLVDRAGVLENIEASLDQASTRALASGRR